MMIKSKIILLVLLTVALYGRENPFEPTQSFLDEKAQIVENEELKKEETIVLSSFEPLKFLTIDVYKNKVTILSSNAKLLKHFKLKDENKIVIDYRKSRNFFTKRFKVENGFVESIAIGDHPKGNYFRVVLTISKKFKFYQLDYTESKNNNYLVSINNLN